MKEALYYIKLNDGLVQCVLCPKNCIIKTPFFGSCNVRKNVNGELMALNYGLPCSISIDPIEKKPLHHVLPGTETLSIATVGCNLSCSFCQNIDISKPKQILGKKFQPQEVIDLALKKNCQSISFTYTEPTIYYEYMLDIAKLAKANNIRTVVVSNGYINQEPLEELIPFIDAFNIDLKAFSNEFYKKQCSATLEPVLETLKTIYKQKRWLEITNLIIPELNDSKINFAEMCSWIKNNLDKSVPLHISKFHPMHKLKKHPSTPDKMLFEFYKIAKEILDHVYIGNLAVDKENNTYCPGCSKLLVGRAYFGIVSNKIKANSCLCGKNVPGYWE
jgi:pyruvate formate lyase activating enzyme